MLTFFYSTNQYKLADRLIEECRHSSSDNLLAPEIFIVQNNGMGQWLSLYMAEQEGIAANLKFEFPSERIWSLIRLMDSDIPQTLPSDRGPLTWGLMQLMEENEILSEFKNLRFYVQENDSEQQAMRKWKLSSKIADVFDQYLIYRPELIRKWDADEWMYDHNEAEAWQKKLWNKLTDYWEGDHKGRWLHRSQLQYELLNAIDSGRLTPDKLPDRISVFGVSSMPPIFIKILIKLSGLTDINFYQLTVDPQVKNSDKFLNPLLQSMGEQGSIFRAQFWGQINADAEKVSQEVTEDSKPAIKSVLEQVQTDLKNDDSSPLKASTDSSIQVHSCHSPMREIQVLYDQLLAVFDENPDLNPDDILIMTPDIATYAPIVEAVFKTPDEGQPGIPYSIADRGVGGAYPAIETFLNILELFESRFKVSDVLNILDADPIQEVFGFTDEELNRLERWIQDNNIRWGIDGMFKQNMDLPESTSFTWQSGLNRMLLGYAMRSEDKLYEGIFPYQEIEGAEAADLAGRFSRLLNTLFKMSGAADQHKTPRQWVKVLSKIPDIFLPDNEDYYWQISKIRETIDRLKNDADLGGFDGEVGFAIIRLWLQDELQEQATGGGRIGRGVTFSSLNPMRSIPFKMIGMVGLNEGAFPRSKIPIEFDLMHLEPTASDPDQTQEDRDLFLENILSAQSHLYFSFVGQSNRQDIQFPPSVVLKEFLDYLQQQYGLDADELIVDHRLQAFSPSYFKGEKLFSYSEMQKKISQELVANDQSEQKLFFNTKLPKPDEEWKRLSINDFISFFQHPAKFLIQKRLGIYPNDQQVLTEDREPFQLDKLDEYKVGQELLQQFFKGSSLEPYEDVLQARDLLPEGWSGKEFYREKVAEVQGFGTEIKQRLQQQLPDREVGITVDGFRIVGVLSNLYQDAQISYRFGKARPKDKIDLWIRHLLLQQLKPESHVGKSMLFSWKNDTIKENRLEPVEESTSLLSTLLQMYWTGLQTPIPFYCRSSFAYAKAVIKDGKDRDDGVSKAVSQWEPSWGGFPGEGDDFYYKLVRGENQPFKSPEFQKMSHVFWDPFFKALKQEET